MAYSLTCGSFDSRRIISSMPSTALIGVRISWDIRAKNFPFASLAAKASCLAASASFLACASRIFCSCAALAFSSAFSRYSLDIMETCRMASSSPDKVMVYNTAASTYSYMEIDFRITFATSPASRTNTEAIGIMFCKRQFFFSNLIRLTRTATQTTAITTAETFAITARLHTPDKSAKTCMTALQITAHKSRLKRCG